MEMRGPIQEFAPNVWIQRFELSMLGGHQGRVCTYLRLESGKLIIHSTGPFIPQDVAAIRALGTPAWLVDSMLRHDTFAQEGRAAFSDLSYLVPPGFENMRALAAKPILPMPEEWAGEIAVLRIEGMPKVDEHVFFHWPSRTIIVADLVFNFAPSGGWTAFMRETLMGVAHHPDSARLYPLQIKDRTAYDRSIQQLFNWEFENIICGHDQPVIGNGKELLRQALARKGIMPAA